MIRIAPLALLLACAGGWLVYVHVWQHGGAHPLAYRLERLPHFETAHPVSHVTTSGNEEQVLIAAGPRSSTGYSLEVVHAVVERARVSIVVRQRDEPGRAQLTYPYRLLVFPKVDKPVHVHFAGR